MFDVNEYSNPPAQTVEKIRDRIPELVRRATGVCVREIDFVRLARWATERARVLSRDGVEAYGELLAEDSVSGRRERELLTVRFFTGETYFFRDQGQMASLAIGILPGLIERHPDERSSLVFKQALNFIGNLLDSSTTDSVIGKDRDGEIVSVERECANAMILQSWFPSRS
jgi:hypothetical protein